MKLSRIDYANVVLISAVGSCDLSHLINHFEKQLIPRLGASLSRENA